MMRSGGADEIRHVERAAAGIACRLFRGSKARLHPRLEGAERMVGQAVVVLHDVEPGARERQTERGELVRRRAPSA